VELREPCVAGVRIERVMPGEVKGPERASRQMREPVAGPERKRRRVVGRGERQREAREASGTCHDRQRSAGV